MSYTNTLNSSRFVYFFSLITSSFQDTTTRLVKYILTLSLATLKYSFNKGQCILVFNMGQSRITLSWWLASPACTSIYLNIALNLLEKHSSHILHSLSAGSAPSCFLHLFLLSRFMFWYSVLFQLALVICLCYISWALFQ